VTRSAGRFGIAVVVSAVLTALWAWPVVTHPHTRILNGPSDATSTIRDYWYAGHVGKTPFTLKHDSFLAAPEGIELSPAVQVANGFQPAVIWPLRRWLGLVAAWNLFVLAGIVLTASCTWLLLDCLGVGTPAAVFGSYAVASSGYMLDKAFAGHGGLVHAWVFPLLVLTLLEQRRRARRLPLAVLAGAIVALAFYVHSYYGAFAVFTVVVFHLVEAAHDRTRRRATLTSLGVAVAVMFAGLLPALVAMRVLVGAPGNGAHPVAALQQFGARVEAYVAPAQWTPLGRVVPHRLRGHLDFSGEPSLYFGLSTLVFAALYQFRFRKAPGGLRDERFVATFALTLVIAAFVMSLPRLFSIGPIGLPTPAWFIGHFSTTIRVYARFGVLVGLGLAILAALAVNRIARTRGTAWAIACVVVLVLELTPTIPAASWVTNRVPAADRWLAAHPGGIAAIYPLVGDEPAAARLQGREYYFQRFHGHPLFSAIVPAMSRVALALHEAAQYFSDDETANILATEHVRYVVLREDVYRELGQATPTLSKTDFRLVATLPDALVYRVLTKPQDRADYVRTHAARLASAIGIESPVDHFGSGFYGAETYKFNTPWRWMSQDAKITVDVPDHVGQLQLQTLAFSNAAPRMLTLYGPDRKVLGRFNVPTAMTPLTFGPFDVAPGKATFTFTATPGPSVLSTSDPRSASVYLNQPVFTPLIDPNS